jgi:predicted HTH domain antitoxin
MSIHLEIPDHVAQALRLPLEEQEQQLLTELAVALYARGILSLGKARELAGLSKNEFGVLLGKRKIPRHYGAEDLTDDLKYAHRQ